MWLFAFHACGMRMVDVMTLRWKDVDFNKNFISKIQVKTRNRNTIPLSEPLIRILEKWKGRNKVFVFDLLSENFDINDHEAIYRRRNSWNNPINTSLRCISHDLKWNQDLTFHVSRHTSAVLALAHAAEISEIRDCQVTLQQAAQSEFMQKKKEGVSWHTTSQLQTPIIDDMPSPKARLTGGSNKKRIGGFGIAPGTAFWVMLWT